MACSLKVAVIGAGVAGLVAARELLREGHRVVVYEKQTRSGGTWVYDERVESDPLGLDPNRETIHTSLYSSLRTNTPRQLMGFSDYPFTVRTDPRDFPGHEEVLGFLSEFAVEFGLGELTRFGTEVIRVERVDSVDGEWVVESRTNEGSGDEEEVFQAVVVCTGHYNVPRLANIPGIEKWPGKQLHGHNYRVPDPFQNQVVVIIGNGSSATISLERSHLLPNKFIFRQDLQMFRFPNWIENVHEDGTIAFEDGFTVCADIIIHCTGYKYSFPFLKTNGIVCVDDNRVGPLYKHVFPPRLSPRLSFVGVPNRVVIFRVMELQSKWISLVLSGKVFLPSKAEMLSDIEEHYQHMEKYGIPKHHTHSLDPYEFEYTDWLATQARVPPMEERLKQMHRELCNIFITRNSDQLDGYRDQWDPNNH